MQEVFLPRSDWLLLGSPMGWGEAALPRLTHAVFLTLAPELRLKRLAARELQRHGERIALGGDREAQHRAFIDWATGYDDLSFPHRSLFLHDAWAARLPCPVLRLDAAPEGGRAGGDGDRLA